MATKTVKAKNVRIGDFIPGLDNLYVVEVGEDYYYRKREIIGHGANGDEVTITLPPDSRLTIRRKSI